jgi:probable phosphoglycerate mutase
VCASGGTAVQTEADLAEWDYGDYEGLRSADIRQQRPGWDVWHDGCPGGEQPADAGVRADRLIARLRGLAGEVALFSHGQFGRVLAARWIGLPVAQGQHFQVDPASVGILGFEADDPRRPVIALWNATASGAVRAVSAVAQTGHLARNTLDVSRERSAAHAQSLNPER